MSESASEYLRTVLAMEANHQAAAVMDRRAAFLRGDSSEVLPEHQQTRAEVAASLREARECFWVTPRELLTKKLAAICESDFPDLAAIAERLSKVAEVRVPLQRLNNDTEIHPAFRDSIRRVTTASPSAANLRREEVFRHIYPHNNADYDRAFQAIQHGITRIRREYPSAFELEAAWLNELYHYNPQWDLPDKGRETSLGCASLVVGVVFVWALIWIVGTIFGLGADTP